MRNKNKKLWSLLLAAGLAAGLSACGGGSGGVEVGPSAQPMGTLRAALTDAPSCGYETVHVTVQKLRVHGSATAGENDSGWSELVLNPARRVDLLSLSNGVLEELGQMPLPAGRYNQLRLVLAENGGAGLPANAVTPTGGASVALDTPSGQQSGIKLNAQIDVEAGKVADVVLDFDACKSVVRRGNSGRYNLKPVITVLPRLSDAGARVIGYVDASLANSGTRVSVQQGGVPIKATWPDANGRFVLYPLPAGSYELVLAAGGRATAVMTGVPVVATTPTEVNSTALPITLPSSSERDVTGTLNPATATLRALQTLGTTTVEVAWAPVLADSGAYALRLPIAAPLKLAYVANPVALNFQPEATAAGKYRLEAASNGVLKTADIDVNAAVPPIDFSF
ncbi:DUF4382 domain-containing protein [Roseateles violae]|uniref:DUF4382 domain-containing protein n=1 Tax=Roseateles violae TaxID=3058042 RepID=A0ABT8DK29_9BURK|nr:DUF4382 domain-containing protein [Pelomonas sp. PFR6]MDN3918770.1 DUF4382 domain-containing protein [Pelomonas sp. PFR6]